MSAAPLVDELLSLTTQCWSRAEYGAARLECLQRVVGFDALYVGAATPEDEHPEPSVTGVNERIVAR